MKKEIKFNFDDLMESLHDFLDHVKGKKKLKMRTTTIHLSDKAKKGVRIGRQQLKDGKFRTRQP